jgi:hypothetical protein
LLLLLLLLLPVADDPWPDGAVAERIWEQHQR